jgi:hypothetical protein
MRLRVVHTFERVIPLFPPLFPHFATARHPAGAVLASDRRRDGDSHPAFPTPHSASVQLGEPASRLRKLASQAYHSVEAAPVPLCEPLVGRNVFLTQPARKLAVSR